MAKKKKIFKKATPEKKAKAKKLAKKVAIVAATGGVGAAILAAKSKKGKKVIAKAKTKIKGAGAKLEAGLKKVVGKAKDVPFAPLFPFKGVMVSALNKKGIKHTNDLSDIAPKFLNHVVRNNFGGYDETGYYNGSGSRIMYEEHIDAKGIAGSVAKTSGGAGLVGIAANAATGNVGGAATGLITEILNYIRKIKNKKEKAAAQAAAGEPITDPLTKEEEQIIAQSEKVAGDLKDTVIEEGEMAIATRIKDFMFSWQGAAILALIVAIAIYAFRKRK